jgi:hypothetical protein
MDHKERDKDETQKGRFDEHQKRKEREGEIREHKDTKGEFRRTSEKEKTRRRDPLNIRTQKASFHEPQDTMYENVKAIEVKVRVVQS